MKRVLQWCSQTLPAWSLLSFWGVELLLTRVEYNIDRIHPAHPGRHQYGRLTSSLKFAAFFLLILQHYCSMYALSGELVSLPYTLTLNFFVPLLTINFNTRR